MSEGPVTEWYLFGDGLLGVCSEDVPFRDRFRSIFGECGVTDPASLSLPRVLCTVRPTSDGSTIVGHFDDPEPLDAARFAIALFPDRSYHIVAEGGGWTIVAGEGLDGGGVAFGPGGLAFASRATHWQPLLGNLALNRVLRLQRDIVFLHAASAVVNGHGAILVGPKEAGKTTLSTTLAARGHSFLGDELAAVRVGTREMLPFRRAVSFREGPRSAAVDDVLAADPHPVIEAFPDGSPRRRAFPRDLFPSAEPVAATLDAVFVLRSFADRPSVEHLTPAVADAGLLAPLASSMWGVPEALRAIRLGALMAGGACYHLDSGSPEDTADLVERILEDGCP